MSDDFDQEELFRQLEASLAANEPVRWVVSDETHTEEWDESTFTADKNRVLREFLQLAFDKTVTLTSLKTLADASPLYARAVVEVALLDMSMFALTHAHRTNIADVFEAAQWLIRIARDKCLVDTPDTAYVLPKKSPRRGDA